MAETNVPSLADLMGQLSGLMTEPKERMRKSVSAAQAIRPIDPGVLESIAKGSLSGAESFANSNAWAMSPEDFKTTMQNRPDAMRLAGDATTLSDAIFGNSERKKALTQVAIDEYDADKQAATGARTLYDSGWNRRLNEKELAERERSNRVRESNERKRIDLESQRVAAYKKSLSASDLGSLAQQPFADSKKRLAFEDRANRLRDKDGKIKEGAVNAFWENQLSANLFKENVKNGYVQDIPDGYKTSDGKVYKKAILLTSPDGLHRGWFPVTGVDPKTGRPTTGLHPLVSATHPALERAASGKGSQRQEDVGFYNVYGGDQ